MTQHRAYARAATAIALTFAAGLAAAQAQNTTLAVTASVTGVCKFSASSTPLTFSAIDPFSASNAVTTANVLYKCTKGTPATGVTATGGLTGRTMTTLANGGDTMLYDLALSGGTQTGTGAGTGTDLTVIVTGTITPARFQNASAGSYSENVTLNITP